MFLVILLLIWVRVESTKINYHLCDTLMCCFVLCLFIIYQSTLIFPRCHLKQTDDLEKVTLVVFGVVPLWPFPVGLEFTVGSKQPPFRDLPKRSQGLNFLWIHCFQVYTKSYGRRCVVIIIMFLTFKLTC